MPAVHRCPACGAQMQMLKTTVTQHLHEVQDNGGYKFVTDLDSPNVDVNVFCPRGCLLQVDFEEMTDRVLDVWPEGSRPREAPPLRRRD